MITLIKKDLLTQEKWTYLLCLVLFIPITSFFTDGSPIRHLLLLIALPFAFVTSLEDKQSKLVNSFPVTRNQIVIGKYLSVIVWFVLSAIIVTIYMFLFLKFAPFPSRMMTPAEYIIALSLIYLSLSVYFPFLFSLGYKLASIPTGIFVFVLFMVYRITLNLAENPRYPEVTEFVQSLNENQWILAGSIFTIAAIFTVISFFISARIYAKKDL